MLNRKGSLECNPSNACACGMCPYCWVSLNILLTLLLRQSSVIAQGDNGFLTGSEFRCSWKSKVKFPLLTGFIPRLMKISCVHTVSLNSEHWIYLYMVKKFINQTKLKTLLVSKRNLAMFTVFRLLTRDQDYLVCLHQRVLFLIKVIKL